MAELEGVDGRVPPARSGAQSRRGRAEPERRGPRRRRPGRTGPTTRTSPHEHPYTKVLYCIVGSIVFHVRDATGEVHDVELEPGDRMELGNGISHAATVGPNGVICVEGALQAT